MRRNPTPKILSWVLLLGAALWAYVQSPQAPSFLKGSFSQDSIVRAVIDGDTVELVNGARLRYIGIDSPESRRKTSIGWQKTDDPFAQRATRLNEELVLGKKVRLEFDAQREDKYQRLLAYCFVKTQEREVLVQAEILRQGLAYLYTAPPNIKYIDTLVEALEDAKRNKRGVWARDLSIASSEAARFVGERKIVEGMVLRARRSEKVIRLKMEGLDVIIFKKDIPLFTREGIDPVEFYSNKKVRVFGLIKVYNNSLEIILSNPWQIDILG